MSLLRYTGHPFVDVGVATITVMSRRRDPGSVTIDDLKTVANELKVMLCKKGLKSFLRNVFPNSPFVQGNMAEAKIATYADRVLLGFLPDKPVIDGVTCAFFPDYPAILYATKQHLPLLNAQLVGNFSAHGSAGVPVSGVALLAIHAMPFACRMCETSSTRTKYRRRLLLFHQVVGQSDDANMMMALSTLAYRENIRAIQILDVYPESQMPAWGRYQKTRYLVALSDAHRQIKRRRNSEMHNITGYLFINENRTSDLEVLRLDNCVTAFLDEVTQDAGQSWSSIVQSSWTGPKKTQGEVSDEDKKRTWRNTVYEDMFQLPERSHWFLARHLSKSVNWKLIEIFLRKVMLMEPERIDTYRRLGDRLVEYMDKFEGDSLGFYYEFSRAKNYSVIRRNLRRAAERMIKAKETEHLFTYDEFIYAFEDPSSGYSQWELARDLISVRMLEQLQKRNVDLTALPDDEEELDDK